MSPALARSAPSELNHWWSKLKFRLQNKKGWNEMLDETFLLQTKCTNDIPLFYAAKRNSVGCIKKFLNCSSTNIFERGALGETALHVAAMSDNLDAAVALMDGAPELINEPMTSDLFHGVTPLHVAVVNQNLNLVYELLIRGADVSTPRVTGLYFRKRIGGLIYYGEHILSFAACAGNEDIISMIIDAGASTRIQDYRGNTVLHILVLQPNKTIACQAIDLIMARDAELDQSVPLDMVANYRGFTPFKLAAKEGNIVAFQHLVNKRRLVQWSLGPLTSHLYDLTEIDSWADNVSVLELIVGSQQKEARRILEVTPVRQLVSLKWNLYGKHYFRLLMVFYLLYIGTFTLCCTYRPLKDSPANYSSSHMDKTIRVQKTLRIIFGDLTKFMWLSFIVLLGFSTSLWMVYMTQDPESIPAYRSFPITLFSQFELSVGLIDLPVDHTFTTPPIVHVLHCAFSVVSYILLLNLLIAMMSDTHWRVAQERDELWRTQVVATTLMLERRLPRCLWPRLGVCGLSYGLTERWYLRVEDRNDPMLQKMRRYMKVFTKEDDNHKEEPQHADVNPKLRPRNRRCLAGWQMIRRSALGMDIELEEPQDEQDIHVCLE
ncbi:transient receptor potential cation channel subfamily V member 6 isoform X4 [Dunckerocampus dactyliophorus]|uniref:transient receptor potential cation channel subfamily V member 6 isoform X4 n=1 Tax=Dunckerocampus dactyliophorus TaxID=161453 RepID=UPI0024054B49|nr:transient receptor potential cation channel subfamily V member 6 isoform X4 [Dunckerocampus dactyliophorus]